MIRTVTANGDTEFSFIAELKARAGSANIEIENTAREIMAEVKSRGYDAVKEYSLRFDRSEPYEISAEAIDRAYAECDKDLIDALEKAKKNIWDYQSRLLVKSAEWSAGDGITLGCVVRGISRLGIYVPGGTAAYPSSVLMTAVPAKVAGVEEIIMVTPPTGFLKREVLAAAKIAGVDRVIAVGGAQAVAALTYGAGFIPQVDKLVGPGNAYVAAAKRMAYGVLDIDMVAGPSEITVIADSTASAEYVAADLLSQAEHDELASAILLTDCAELASEVALQCEKQTAALPRAQIIKKSLGSYGGIIVCESLEKCAELANLIAPEHLEIMTAEPRSVLPGIKNAGAVFLGRFSSEPLGDYMAGPSHVLPTSSTARFFSPLSVDSFLKKMSVIEYSSKALNLVSDDIIRLATSEELDAHANAIRLRKNEM